MVISIEALIDIKVAMEEDFNAVAELFSWSTIFMFKYPGHSQIALWYVLCHESL